MEHTEDNRLPLTAGILTLPTEDQPCWFNIFVLDSNLYLEIAVQLEIADWVTHTYSAPMFLLDDARERGYELPETAVQAIERFAVSGAQVLEAMVDSIKTEMQAIARHAVTESRWLTQPEELIWLLIKVHVPDDIQLPVFGMLKKYRHVFDDDGKIQVERSEP